MFQKFLDILIIFLLILSLILQEGLCITDHKPDIMILKIVFHLFVLCETPFEEVGLHVLDNDVAWEVGGEKVVD